MTTVLRCVFGGIYVLISLGALYECGLWTLHGAPRKALGFFVLSLFTAFTGWMMLP